MISGSELETIKVDRRLLDDRPIPFELTPEALRLLDDQPIPFELTPEALRLIKPGRSANYGK